MLTMNDGRSELWQWDTGRKLTVDAECSQVHFSNKVFGRSIDVDVVNSVAVIPDILLQTDKDLIAWAFIGTPENGYTKMSKVFKVNKRNKPADYVFTPTEQTTLDGIMKRLDQIEESQDPDAIKNAVEDYLENNPIRIEETDPTVPGWAKQPTKPGYTAAEVGAQPKKLVVSYDYNSNTATHSAVEINEHIQNGGIVTLYEEDTEYDYVHGGEEEAVFRYIDYINSEQLEAITLVIYQDKTGEVDRLTYTIPTVPTKVSAFENDAEYAKSSEIPTDDHINQLINTALGVIENAVY